MLYRLGDALTRISRRAVPDPFVLAFALTGIVALGGAVLLISRGGAAPARVPAILFEGWLADFSSGPLLGFALQMCLVLVTGHALALSPPVQRAIAAVAAIPRGAASATFIVAAFACLAALVHWGLGAIAPAFLAREIGRHARQRGLELHYPLLGAGAYAGMAVWHGGLSGSAPTKVAEEGAISLASLLFSPLNLAVTGSLVILIPLLLARLAPRQKDQLIPPPPDLEASIADPATSALSPVAIALGALGTAAVVLAIAAGPAALDINTINAIFFFSGLALVGNFSRYIALAADGARGAGAIIIQFPLYFGILGIMKASGMVAWLSEVLVSVSSRQLLGVMDFFSAGVVNLAIPSGGGQWVVQRDILLAAGERLGVSPVTTIMAFSYGDAWTNMLQPFWALPLLGVMGLKASEIIGYTAAIFLLLAAVVPFWLLVLG